MKSTLEEQPEELHFSMLDLLPPDERRLVARYNPGENWLQSREALCEELGISMKALDVRVRQLRRKMVQQMARRIDDAPATPSDSQAPPLESLRYLLQSRFPVLYAKVLEPTLADLREEHAAALAERCSWKARRVLLKGCGALAAAGICQLGLSLLGCIAALWQARSSK